MQWIKKNIPGFQFHPNMPPRPEKQSQISEDEHFLLHDVCCLWLWVKQKMAESFTVTEVEKHQELFDKGCFSSNNQLTLLQSKYIVKIYSVAISSG